MKRSLSFLCIICVLLIAFMVIPDTVKAGTVKWLRVGSYWKPVADSGDEGEGNIGWNTNGMYYYHGFTRHAYSTKAVFIGTEDWTDSLGTLNPIWISGNGQWDTDETNIMLPIPDADGFTMHRYLRNTPPEIYVDDFPLHDPFPRQEDEHLETNDEIPGNADALLLSTIRTNMGLTIDQKVFAWDEKNHDDYVVFDWTFTNTGNGNFNDAIEFPNQTLQDVFFFRQLRFAEEGDVHQRWGSAYGEYMSDTLRIPGYGLPTNMEGATWDHFGNMDVSGDIYDPGFMAETVLFAESNDDEYVVSGVGGDDLSQPRMTGIQDCDLPFVVRHPYGMSESDWANLYQVSEFGLLPYDGSVEMDDPDIYPGTHHSTRFVDRGFKYATDYEAFGWSLAAIYAVGPYTLEPGESFNVVWADVYGSINRDLGWEIGKAWVDGNSETAIPYVDRNGTTIADGGEDNLLEKFTLFPELAPTDNDKNKDRWVLTGIDSLHQNANAAKWNWDNDYTVPEAPPAPSIWVYSRPDGVEIEWGTESESASDFAGYRVYRATGHADSTWELLETYNGTGTHLHIDQTAYRGIGYYYQVSAFDDGTSNAVGVKGVKEVQESGRYLNRTTLAAYLTRPAGTLDQVVVVPNPYNINARELQFIGEQDKIMFLNVPGYCNIYIYTESGDLVKKVVHDDGSGDQSWGVLPEEYSATQSSQIVVSGLYLARIEETDKDMKPTGDERIVKFLIVR